MVGASNSADAPSANTVWRWLDEVADPEIPVVSVVDLGIVRGVEWRGDAGRRKLHVTITPTYSGCPATEVIAADIVETLRARGVQSLEIETRIAPPWTTDWISEDGKRKLEAFGIAPPRTLAAGESPSCPRCGASDTARVAQFGSTPCKALYRCNACLEPFDYFKCL